MSMPLSVTAFFRCQTGRAQNRIGALQDNGPHPLSGHDPFKKEANIAHGIWMRDTGQPTGNLPSPDDVHDGFQAAAVRAPQRYELSGEIWTFDLGQAGAHWQ